MSEEILTPEVITGQSQVIDYNITDAKINELKQNYLPMQINGIEDKEGYKAVVEARKTVKGLRLDVEKKRKELNADALEWQRKVNAEAKRITGELEPIEEYLSKQEDAFEAEKERIKQEKEMQAQIQYDMRLKKILSIGFDFNGALYQFRDHAININQLKTWSDEEFISFMNMAEHDWKLDQDKKAEEARLKAEKEAQAEEDRRKEQEALDAEKARLKAIQEEQDRQAAELEKEKAAFLKMKSESEAVLARAVPVEVVSTPIQAKDFPEIKPVLTLESFSNEVPETPATVDDVEKAVEEVFGEETEVRVVSENARPHETVNLIESIHILVEHTEFEKIKHGLYRNLNLIDKETGAILRLK